MSSRQTAPCLRCRKPIVVPRWREETRRLGYGLYACDRCCSGPHASESLYRKQGIENARIDREDRRES